MEQVSKTETDTGQVDWRPLRGYTTRDGDRITLMEREPEGRRAIIWSYGDQSPQFTEIPDRAEALVIFMRSYLAAERAGRIADSAAVPW